MASKEYSSEDDDDYVPTLKELKEAELERPTEDKNKVLTGVALLRDQKR